MKPNDMPLHGVGAALQRKEDERFLDGRGAVRPPGWSPLS